MSTAAAILCWVFVHLGQVSSPCFSIVGQDCRCGLANGFKMFFIVVCADIGYDLVNICN